MEIWRNIQLEDLEGEIWQPIREYEKMYHVSNLGRIKAIPRKTKTWEIKWTKILKLKMINGNYIQTKFSKNGSIYCPIVSRIVAETFCNPPSYKWVANHKNCIRWDNRAENLECITQSQNMRYAFKLGRKSQKGEHNNQAKITLDLAKEIRKFKVDNDHLSQKQIAEHFGLKREHIKDIITFKSWNY